MKITLVTNEVFKALGGVGSGVKGHTTARQHLQDAIKRANGASTIAATSGNPAHHLKAADLHQAVAGMAQQMGDSNTAAQHMKQAQVHQLKSNAKDAKGRGSGYKSFERSQDAMNSASH